MVKIKVVAEQAEDGRFFVYVPALPGVIAEGATIEDAEMRLRAEITNYLEPCEEDLYSAPGELMEISV